KVLAQGRESLKVLLEEKADLMKQIEDLIWQGVDADIKPKETKPETAGKDS
ncbi:MAG: hypothetical protein ACD_52C00166G0001, partial [uncultured bacterium]